MVQRRAAQAAIVACLLLALPLVVGTPQAHAQEEPASSEESSYEDSGFAGYWDDDAVEPAMKSVSGMDTLRTTRDVQSWEKRNRFEEEDEPETSSVGPLEALFYAIGEFLSIIVELALWIAAAILLVLLIATRERWLPYFRFEPGRRPERQRVFLAGEEITAAELPEDIPAEVTKLWQNGHRREAMSLLFRGSVFAAVTRHGVRLPPSATESACIAAVRQRGDSQYAEYFRRVVDAWVWCAYGSIEPADEELVRLCDEWPRHYGDIA